MTWAEHHEVSERLASQAEVAQRTGDLDTALARYRAAAEAEERALGDLDPAKTRTLGITAVSAASLWFMGHDYARAQQVAYALLGRGVLPPFAVSQMRDLLQTIWGEEMRAHSGVRFLPGDVTVSVSGGQVVYGAAPLDLILRKVEEVKAVVIRTIEMKLGRPLRRGRAPSAAVTEFFEPWLVQQPAGSYQFAVRVRAPAQRELFPDERPEVASVATTALEIMRASVEDPGKELERVVPDPEYRSAFLKLARNLAPTGKSFERLSLGSGTAAAAPVVMLPAARTGMNEALRQYTTQAPRTSGAAEVQIRGILRGLSLNRDWLDVTVAKDDGSTEEVRVYDAGETLDDVIGPMVNRPVVIDAYRNRGAARLHLRDIQAEE